MFWGLFYNYYNSKNCKYCRQSYLEYFIGHMPKIIKNI